MTIKSFGMIIANYMSAFLQIKGVLSHQIKSLNSTMLGLYSPLNLIRQFVNG
ncbi:MAG: hypothetical protein ACJAZT_001930 [Gammaproteobacteria bacterium]|jgi:hypothetical protein